MFSIESNKLHPVLDFDEAKSVFDRSKRARPLDGEIVTSPFHMYSVETLRDRLGLRIGHLCPTDAFVFGLGEPPRRDTTKIGGLAYWPKGRHWPTNSDGFAYRYFGQVCFADSRDLMPNLPADVLLIFVGERDDWMWLPMDIHFEWLPVGLADLIESNPTPNAFESGPFFGAIHRTADYPDAEAVRDAELCDLLSTLSATKIGGVAHRVQETLDTTGELLVQVASIQPAFDEPFAFVNRAAPIPLDMHLGKDFSRRYEVMFGDMGSIYVLRDALGELQSTFACY